MAIAKQLVETTPSQERLPLVRKIIDVRPTTDWYKLVAFGDWHVGHKQCDIPAIKEMISFIKSKDPRSWGVVLTGDLMENVLPSTKGSMFELSIPDPQDQIEVVTELLRPIANSHVICMVSGNHEERTTRVTGLDPGKIISNALNIPYKGYHCMLNLGLKRKGKKTNNYLAYIEHGCGSIPKKMGGRLGKMESTASRVQADVYIKGHIHHKLAFQKYIWKYDGVKPVKRKCVFLSNGAYLVDAEYAIRSGFEPTTSGVAKALLAVDRFDIHANI